MAEEYLSKFSLETLELLLKLNEEHKVKKVDELFTYLFDELLTRFTKEDGSLSVRNQALPTEYYLGKIDKKLVITNDPLVDKNKRSEPKNKSEERFNIKPLMDDVINLSDKAFIGYGVSSGKLKVANKKITPEEFKEYSKSAVKSLKTAFNYIIKNVPYVKGMLASNKKKEEKDKSFESKALYKTLDELAQKHISVDDVNDTFSDYFFKDLTKDMIVNESPDDQKNSTFTGRGAKGASMPKFDDIIKLGFGENKQESKNIPLRNILDFWEKSYITKEYLDKIKKTDPENFKKVYEEVFNNYLFEVYKDGSDNLTVRPVEIVKGRKSVKRMKFSAYRTKVNRFLTTLENAYKPLFEEWKDKKTEKERDTHIHIEGDSDGIKEVIIGLSDKITSMEAKMDGLYNTTKLMLNIAVNYMSLIGIKNLNDKSGGDDLGGLLQKLNNNIDGMQDTNYNNVDKIKEFGETCIKIAELLYSKTIEILKERKLIHQVELEIMTPLNLIMNYIEEDLKIPLKKILYN